MYVLFIEYICIYFFNLKKKKREKKGGKLPTSQVAKVPSEVVQCVMWCVAAPCLQKERRLLENRRLDLDICKARLKKAKQAEAKAAVRAPHTPCSCHRRRGGELHMTAIWKRNCRKILFVNNCIVAFNTELNHEQNA